jgi:mono/diheme cytochrome c family protein
MKWRTPLFVAGATLGLAAALGGAIVFGGVLSVAATEPEPELLQWLLSTTMKSSVENHARDIVVPDGIDLADPALAQRAFGHFSVACTPCHGGPGIEPAPWLVLDPPARSLADTAADWEDNELYWIVKHGIQMTGMPALGPTHEDADLWAIAAFVRQLPDMTAEHYQQMATRHAAAHAGHEGHGMSPPAPPVQAAPTAIETRSTAAQDEAVVAPEPKSKRSARKPRKPTQPPMSAPPLEAPVASPAEREPEHPHAHHHH